MNQCVKMVNGIKMKAKLIRSENSYILKDGLNHVLGIDDKKLKDRLECPYLLSKQNCDEIFGVVNVETLGEEIWNDLGVFNIQDKNLWFGGFRNGINKAMELNRFTLEDIRKAYYVGYEDGKSGATFFQQLIQSLQQPTEIEVEFEMQCLDPTCDGVNKKGVCIPGNKPKLDENGCLILKKVMS